MFIIKSQHQKPSSCPIFLRRIGVILIIFCVAPIIGCTPEATPTQIVYVYPTSMLHCLPSHVFTAEDMRARVDCHPDNYKMEITKDTVFLFSFPDPVIDWEGSMSIFIIHIPSVSELTLNTDGSVFSEDYTSSEGRNAIEEVLNNQQLMTSSF